MRGRGLPAWPRGVTVPISTAPRPRAAKAAGARASLSSPAASPTGLGKRQPGDAHRQARVAHGEEALQEGQHARAALGQPQQAQGQLVGPLRVEAPQDLPGGAVPPVHGAGRGARGAGGGQRYFQRPASGSSVA